MRKHFMFLGIAYFFVFLLIFGCAGNDKKDDGGTTSSTTATTNTAATDAVPASTTQKGIAVAGTLNNLWVEASKFKGLPSNKKLVLSFTFRDPDILTLYGWACQNNNCTAPFLNDPSIKFENGRATNAQYGPNVIFGNVIIDARGMKTIQDKLGTKYTYVVLVPDNDKEYIKYKVFVTTDDPTKFTDAVNGEDTGIELNPSPPRN